ncbi:hypothetical protein HBI73_106410 [Parastagonospora nodorum]|nr:hypothetical protein HBH42_164360 [Parastagonospora nodorum]KAH5117979.1 hypothetical protein HBI73_106410 [Parastagonospora nodorum]KAH5249919.1 hypothetical protein HBI72_154380 [Parastagonospora nodorum]KAH5461643.1 hypothetical protein HBI31_225520 [Parastagonospora nodorum]KAH6085119.1 hypothetical protein HBI65_196940 [Parastagonospora nodorum]
MDDTIKAGREQLYANYNSTGTTDWAIDLQEFTVDEDVQENDPRYGHVEHIIEIRDQSACDSW